MFAQTNDAEAVLVQFDLEKVIEWLDENALLADRDDPGEFVARPDTDDDEAVRNWFVANIDRRGATTNSTTTPLPVPARAPHDTATRF